MKKINLTHIVFLSSLALVANAQKKTNCVNLDPLSVGQLKFTVNDQQANPDPSNPNAYPVDFKIKIYNKQKLDTTFQLKKGTSNVIIIKIDPSSTKNYCVQVHRKASIISYRQIHWTEEHDTQASANTPFKPSLYVSNDKRKLYFATRTITSKNGTSSDGVKVLID